jgi:CBS-domain-containing membrane protein
MKPASGADRPAYEVFMSSTKRFILPPVSGKEHLRRAVSARVPARKLRRGLERLVGESAGHTVISGARRPRRHVLRRFGTRFLAYFYKMRGRNPATADFSLVDTLWSFCGSFLGILALALVNIEVWGRQEQGLLLGSFGASCVLVFGAPHAPFAQPRNVVGGHVVSALSGVLAQSLLGGEYTWAASALAVALSISAMHVTATLHPPGGATALIAVVGSAELKSYGYSYALYPVGLSVLVLVLIGVVWNNFSKARRYPMYWW